MEAKGEWLKLHLRSPTSPSLKDKGPPSGFLSWLDIDPDYKMVLKPHPCHSLDGRLKGAWTAFGKNRVTDGMDEQAWRKPYVFHSIISQTLSMGFSIYFLFFFPLPNKITEILQVISNDTSNDVWVYSIALSQTNYHIICVFLIFNSLWIDIFIKYKTTWRMC